MSFNWWSDRDMSARRSRCTRYANSSRAKPVTAAAVSFLTDDVFRVDALLMAGVVHMAHPWARTRLAIESYALLMYNFLECCL